MTGSKSPCRRSSGMRALAGLGAPNIDHDIQDHKSVGKQIPQAQPADVARQPPVGIWRSGRWLAGAVRSAHMWLANLKPRMCSSAAAKWGAATSACCSGLWRYGIADER